MLENAASAARLTYKTQKVDLSIAHKGQIFVNIYLSINIDQRSYYEINL